MDDIIEIQPGGFKNGIKFEIPRHPLMRTMGYEIFDDLLTGNFMKTSLVGKWPDLRLFAWRKSHGGSSGGIEGHGPLGGNLTFNLLRGL